MKFLSFLPHKIFCLRRNFKNAGDINLSVLDRTINFFIFLSTCCSVAPLDLPHFTLESSQMPFKHIHYKLAGFFFSFNRKKKTLRFLMNPLLLVLQWFKLILSRHFRYISGISFNICRGFVNSRAILSFFVTEFDQIRDSFVCRDTV